MTTLALTPPEATATIISETITSQLFPASTEGITPTARPTYSISANKEGKRGPVEPQQPKEGPVGSQQEKRAR